MAAENPRIPGPNAIGAGAAAQEQTAATSYRTMPAAAPTLKHSARAANAHQHVARLSDTVALLGRWNWRPSAHGTLAQATPEPEPVPAHCR